jgi:hypothetical protein
LVTHNGGMERSDDLDVTGGYDEEPSSSRRARRWPWKGGSGGSSRLAAVAVLAGVLLVGGIGVALAQDSGSSTTTAPSTSVPGQPNLPGGPGGPRFKGGGPGGKFGHGGGGPNGAIHGEFVTPDGSGGYRTVDVQTGEATEVSSDSITVKSADGFSKTYSVDQNTVVNSGRDGIGTVKKGDTVRVDAVVSGGKAAARSIMDVTTLGQIRQHWNPGAPQGGGPAAGVRST